MQLNIYRAISELRDAALTAIYPQQCRVCGAGVNSWRDGVACEDCWLEIENDRGEDCCSKCGLPLPPLPGPLTIDDRRCGRCDKFAFSHARACGTYQGALRESVLWLKANPRISPRLREILRTKFYELDRLQSCDSIIPVPLHPKRLTERSFNQAEVIADAIASISGLRTDAASLVRVKETSRHRAGMGVRERSRSLEKAFKVRAPRLVENRVILLVDDVMTTGATINQAALALIDSGARAVNILTIARAKTEFDV